MYDICFINGIEKVVAQPGIVVQMDLDMRGVTGGGSIIADMQKLAQRFVKMLMTEQGTVLFRETEGCGFMTAVKQGRLRTSADVSQTFASAMMDIRRQFSLQTLDADTPTDRLQNAELIGSSINDGRLVLSVRLLTLAGETPVISVSLPTLPRR